MKRGSRESNRWRVVTVVTTVAVLSVVGWFFLRTPGEPAGADGATIGAPEDSALDKAERKEARKAARELARPAKLSGKPGLEGEGFSIGIDGIDLRISVTSSSPIGTIGYLIPTSQDSPNGTVNGVGTSWSLSTQVFGPGDHARVFFQAGASGAPVTCVITVDGEVTERRSTVGPYGQTMCQG